MIEGKCVLSDGRIAEGGFRLHINEPEWSSRFEQTTRFHWFVRILNPDTKAVCWSREWLGCCRMEFHLAEVSVKGAQALIASHDRELSVWPLSPKKDEELPMRIKKWEEPWPTCRLLAQSDPGWVLAIYSCHSMIVHGWSVDEDLKFEPRFHCCVLPSSPEAVAIFNSQFL